MSELTVKVNDDGQDYSEYIERIIRESDRDFVPPISDVYEGKGIDEYIGLALKENLITAVKEGNLWDLWCSTTATEVRR